MRTLDIGFAAHIESGATTLATCWKLIRTDAVVLGFTDHDQPLSFAGTDYRPMLDGSETGARLGPQVDTAEAIGVLRSDAITEADIVAGRYDGATVEIWRVNWREVSQRLLQRRASIGEIVREDGQFRAELRSGQQALNRVRGRLYAPLCDAVPGDARCTVSAGHPAFALWTWDARPYPAFPSLLEVWRDGANHATGHWLTGRLGGLAGDEVLRAVAADYGVALDAVEAQPPFVHGYVLEAPMTARQALEPVLALGGLAIRDGVDGLCVGRADGSAALVVDEVVAGEGPLVSRRRPDPGEAIGQVALSYADRERNYLAGAVTAIADSGGALEAVAAGMVLDIGGARRAAERLLIERNGARETVELTLPPSQAQLEVGDSLALDGTLFEITEIRDGLARRVAGRAILPELTVAFAADRPPPAGTAPARRALPVLAAAHLPPLPDDLTRTRLVLGAFARPWPGEVEVTEEGSGTTLARLGRAATMGVLTAPLGAGSIFTWDSRNALELTLAGGHLSSRDEADVLGGANRLAVETDAGAWEIVGFAAADLVAPAAYRLTRLLRGQDGTDHAVGGASAGNRVLLLDARAASLPVPPAWLGAQAELRSFAGPTDGEGVAATAGIGLAPMLPLRPVHLRAERLAGGDIALGWVRRSRADTGR